MQADEFKECPKRVVAQRKINTQVGKTKTDTAKGTRELHTLAGARTRHLIKEIIEIAFHGEIARFIAHSDGVQLVQVALQWPCYW